MTGPPRVIKVLMGVVPHCGRARSLFGCRVSAYVRTYFTSSLRPRIPPPAPAPNAREEARVATRTRHAAGKRARTSREALAAACWAAGHIVTRIAWSALDDAQLCALPGSVGCYPRRCCVRL